MESTKDKSTKSVTKHAEGNLSEKAGSKDGSAIISSSGTAVSKNKEKNEKKVKNSAAASTSDASVATVSAGAAVAETNVSGDTVGTKTTDKKAAKKAADAAKKADLLSAALRKPATESSPASTVLVNPYSSDSLSKTTQPKATAGGGVDPLVPEPLDDLLSKVESLTNSVLSKKGQSKSYAEAAAPYTDQTVEDLKSQLEDVVRNRACETARRNAEEMVRMQDQLANDLIKRVWEPKYNTIVQAVENVKASIIATTDQAPTDAAMKMANDNPDHPVSIKLIEKKAQFDTTLSSLHDYLKDLEERLRLHLISKPLTHAEEKAKNEKDKIEALKKAENDAKAAFETNCSIFYEVKERDGKVLDHANFAYICKSLAQRKKVSFTDCARRSVDPNVFCEIKKLDPVSKSMVSAFTVNSEEQVVQPLGLAEQEVLAVCFKYWTKVCNSEHMKHIAPPHKLVANAVRLERDISSAVRKEKIEQRKTELESYKSSAGAPAVARPPVSAPSPLPSNQFAALDPDSNLTEQSPAHKQEAMISPMKRAARGGCVSAAGGERRTPAFPQSSYIAELCAVLIDVNRYAGGLPVGQADFTNSRAWTHEGMARPKVFELLTKLGYPVGTKADILRALEYLNCIASDDSVIQTKKGTGKTVRRVLCTSAKPTASHASSCDNSKQIPEDFPALSRLSTSSVAPAPAPASAPAPTVAGGGGSAPDATTIVPDAGGGGSAPAPDATTVVVPDVGGGGSAPAPAPAAVDIVQQIAKYKHCMRNKKGYMDLDQIRGDDMPSGAVNALDEILAYCKARKSEESLTAFLVSQNVIEVNGNATFRMIQ
jgi:hypothetical protein